FAESPFFEKTSNNFILTSQAQHNAGMIYVLQTREPFENRLRTMEGIEFMVANDALQSTSSLRQQKPPSQEPGAGGNSLATPEDDSVWVIRKQKRQKSNTGSDEVTVLATYFVIGENVYMAPTIGNVIGNKLVSLPTLPF